VSRSSAWLELLIPSVCPACDRPRWEAAPLLCSCCRGGLHALPLLRGIRTALAYEETTLQLVQRFKFEDRRDALAVLLEPLLERLAGLDFEGVVPVPRHPQRIREQGSDPAHLLARAVARRSGRPLWSRVLRRSRPTLPQSELPAARRPGNVAGSFTARESALRNRRVLLLDDVTTTGSTLREAVRALRRARPRAIIPVALAGTPTLPSAPPPAL
jgi:ComF family protein